MQKKIKIKWVGIRLSDDHGIKSVEKFLRAVSKHVYIQDTGGGDRHGGYWNAILSEVPLTKKQVNLLFEEDPDSYDYSDDPVFFVESFSLF